MQKIFQVFLSQIRREYLIKRKINGILDLNGISPVVEMGYIGGIEPRNAGRGYTMKTNESAENYLETILILSHKLPVVRSVDIATELGFKKSSVSVAMKNLREKGHITVTEAGYIYLTDDGRAIAEMIYERHSFLTQCLTALGVPEDIAEEAACKIEHVISKESFEAIKKAWLKSAR